jgi:glucans biosynthesis protein C
MSNGIDSRRYDIDWLRTFAFLLLIFYHIGQFYVADWQWHVKSEYQSDFLKNIMLLVNQWRIPLIFVISGIALALVEPKISAMRLLKLRLVRIYIPLIVGLYLVVPPQLYYELIQGSGYTGSYWEFFSFYVDINTDRYPEKHHGPIGLLTWNHLWYLAYLFHYTLVYFLLKPLISRINWGYITQNTSLFIIVFLPTSLLVIYDITLEDDYPKTNALVDDWYNHAVYFTIFLLGYILAKSKHLWDTIINHRKLWMACACVSFTLIILRFNRVGWLDAVHAEYPIWAQLSLTYLWSVNKILWLLTMISFAGAYLNRKSKLLRYMNEAILPWYILHQTIIIFVAMNLSKYALGGMVEPTLVVISTFIGCAIGYEIVRRFALTRFLFGMKLLNKTTDSEFAASEQYFKTEKPI